MPDTNLPTRFPAGTKYVLEGHGPVVRRYVELPNGRRIKLDTRKALTCTSAQLQTSIVPKRVADGLDFPIGDRRIFA